MRPKTIVLIIAAILTAAVVGLYVYAYRDLLSLKLKYLGRRTEYKTFGKPVYMTPEEVDLDAPIPTTQYMGVSMYQEEGKKIDDSFMKSINLNDLAKAITSGKVVYARMSWNVTNDGEIRDWNFGVLATSTGSATQVMLDELKQIPWLQKCVIELGIHNVTGYTGMI